MHYCFYADEREERTVISDLLLHSNERYEMLTTAVLVLMFAKTYLGFGLASSHFLLQQNLLNCGLVRQGSYHLDAAESKQAALLTYFSSHHLSFVHLQLLI